VGLGLDPVLGRHLLNEMNTRLGEFTRAGLTPVLVVGTELRLPLRRFLEPSFGRLVVLAFQELPLATEIENVGLIAAPVSPAVRPEQPALRAA
jgi:flagellar biosynthesis protein FlhA